MFDFLQHVVATNLLMVFGIAGVFFFGSPIENKEKAERRTLMLPELQKLYFENRQLSLVLSMAMILAACFIRNW